MSTSNESFDRAGILRKGAILGAIFFLATILVVGPPGAREVDRAQAAEASPSYGATELDERPFPTLREPAPRPTTGVRDELAWEDREPTPGESHTAGPPGL